MQREALARIRATRNARLGSANSVAPLAVPLLSLAAFVGGFLFWPTEISPTTSGAVTHFGGAPLELAFAGATLISALVTFSVFELLFRERDLAALRLFAVSGEAKRLDRLTRAWRLGLISHAPLFAFLLPGLGRQGWQLPATALLFVAISALAAPSIAFGTVVAGFESVRKPGQSPVAASQVLQIIPGIAFAAVVTVLLLAKLGIEEPLRQLANSGSIGFPNSARVGVGAAVGLSLLALTKGARDYAKHHAAYETMLQDVDTLRFGAGVAYPWDRDRFPITADSGAKSADMVKLRAAIAVQTSRALFPMRAALIAGVAIGVVIQRFSADHLFDWLVGACIAAILLFVWQPARRVRAIEGFSDSGLLRIRLPRAEADSLVSYAIRLEIARVAAFVLPVCLIAGPTDGLRVLAQITPPLICLCATASRSAPHWTLATVLVVGAFSIAPGPAVAIGAFVQLAVLGALCFSALRRLSSPRET